MSSGFSLLDWGSGVISSGFSVLELVSGVLSSRFSVVDCVSGVLLVVVTSVVMTGSSPKLMRSSFSCVAWNLNHGGHLVFSLCGGDPNLNGWSINDPRRDTLSHSVDSCCLLITPLHRDAVVDSKGVRCGHEDQTHL